jgi:hypothetical protein
LAKTESKSKVIPSPRVHLYGSVRRIFVKNFVDGFFRSRAYVFFFLIFLESKKQTWKGKILFCLREEERE